MANTQTGNLAFLSTILNDSGTLLEATWGLASFPTPTLVNGNFVFYVSGSEGISVHSLLQNGTWLELEQGVTDTSESLLSGLYNVEVFEQGGVHYLIGNASNDAALNVYQIDEDTGLLTFVSATTEAITLASTTFLDRLSVGGQDFVVTTSLFNENLAIWTLSGNGTLTRTALVSGSGQPLWGVGDIATFNLEGGLTSERDGFVTAAYFEGLTLWDINAAGQVTQRDHVLITAVDDVDVGTYRTDTFLLAGSTANRNVKVIEIAGDQMTEVSTFDLQAQGFFGNVSAVKSFNVDGVRLAVVVTGVGEILLLGMRQDGTLELVESHVWQDFGSPPTYFADDVELVYTDGQAFLVVAGTQPTSQSDQEGVSVFALGNGNDFLTGGAGNDDLLGFADQDDLFGGGGADRLYGGKEGDELHGGAGADLLYGGLGHDLIYGGSGNDRISGSAAGDSVTGNDSMDGGFGVDTLDYEVARGRVVINLATQFAGGNGAAGDVIVGFENVRGSRFDDVLTGDAGDNILSGNSGDDKLTGGDGHDDLTGGKGDDTLNGDAGNDFLSGSTGLNQLYGGAGNDIVRVGGGNDYARGGAGADTFDWIPTAAEISRIYDFTQGEDRVEISVNMTEEEVFAALTTIGGVHAYLFINGDRGLIIRNITAEELTAADFLFNA